MELSLLLLAGLCTLAAVFLGLGIYGRHQLIAKHNACKMTYSSSSASYINIPTRFTSPFRLLRYQQGDSNSPLNPYPVLFIPGAWGSFDQVRSLASGYSHNKKQRFQYFTIDFNLSLSAFHAAAFMQQAAFVNEAVHSISALYAMSQGTPCDIYDILTDT